jgi:hypothetical protein
MHLGHHVLAVHNNGLPSWGAQGNVQDGPLLGDVDLLPPEHRIDSGPQTGFLGQLQEERERLGSDAALRVVEIDADGFDGHALAAFGIVGKERTEMQLPELLVMGLEGLQGWALHEWRDACCHVRPPFDA